VATTGHGATDPRVTLRDIAEAAGVALSTASRVLSRAREGHAPRSEAAARVLAVADEMNYERDLFAASLRTRRTQMLGVLVPRLTDVVLSTMYEGIDEAASALGYQTVVANTLDSPEEQRRRAEMLIGRRVDGLILGDARVDDPYLDQLAARGVPFVLFNRRHEPYDSVSCDDVAGGRLVGNHLADLGHRRIAIIAGEPYARTAIDRVAGCVAALAERGIEVPSSSIIPSHFDAEGGRGAANRLLRTKTPPSAIFAVNDMTAIGAMGALRDQGYQVGVDVAVVGFNDISIASELSVPLTTVRSPLTEIGQHVARLLIARLTTDESRADAAREPTEIRLPPRLVVRASSDPSVTTRLPHRTGVATAGRR
jgi:LacI family transcriptional regulator